MRIAQITDPHVAAAPTVHDGAGTLARVLADVATLKPAPDLVMLTGDMAADGVAPDYALLRSVLAGCGLPMAAVPGNHDRRADFAATLRDAGARVGELPFLNLSLDLGPLRVLALDTLDEGRSAGLLCESRLAWAAAQLDEAIGRPVLLYMHHPPFMIGQAVADGSACRNGARLGALVARHGGVLAVSCGHVHRPVQRLWAGTLGNVCPSVAWEVALDQPAQGPVHLRPQRPGYQLHDWRPDTGLVVHTRILPDL